MSSVQSEGVERGWCSHSVRGRSRGALVVVAMQEQEWRKGTDSCEGTTASDCFGATDKNSQCTWDSECPPCADGQPCSSSRCSQSVDKPCFCDSADACGSLNDCVAKQGGKCNAIDYRWVIKESRQSETAKEKANDDSGSSTSTATGTAMSFAFSSLDRHACYASVEDIGRLHGSNPDLAPEWHILVQHIAESI